jgi:hypothetical protein
MVRKLKERKTRDKPKKFPVFASVQEYFDDKAEAMEEANKMAIDTKRK